MFFKKTSPAEKISARDALYFTETPRPRQQCPRYPWKDYLSMFFESFRKSRNPFSKGFMVGLRSGDAAVYGCRGHPEPRRDRAAARPGVKPLPCKPKFETSNRLGRCCPHLYKHAPPPYMTKKRRKTQIFFSFSIIGVISPRRSASHPRNPPERHGPGASAPPAPQHSP